MMKSMVSFALLSSGAALQFRGDSASAKACEKFAFLRIQKTGSTTFEELIPKMSYVDGHFPTMDELKAQWRMPLTHLNFNDLSAEVPAECIVTFLRDPVDRMLSEFYMLRSPDSSESHMLDEDQWDYAPEDMERIDQIRTNPNELQALRHWNRFAKSPSRNRQTLYLLGFDRVDCRPGCCGVCNHGAQGAVPGALFDWDDEGMAGRLLNQAKEHLSQLLGFGITDCFEDSLGFLADAIGWDRAETMKKASGLHARDKAEGSFLQMQTGMNGTSLAYDTVTEMSALRARIPKEILDEIREYNAIDDKLIKWAKALYHERHGVWCGGNATQSAQ